MSKYWHPAPFPKSTLGRYRQLSPLAGVRVSPICLGAMSIGDRWAELGMGAMDKETSFKLLDEFYAAGGNFIDTANAYQDESSEDFIGEWMEQRGIRDQIVVATKVRFLPSSWATPTPDCDHDIVHNELQAPCERYRTKSPLHRQQPQSHAHLRRSLPQETPHRLYRHPLRPLGV